MNSFTAFKHQIEMTETGFFKCHCKQFRKKKKKNMTEQLKNFTEKRFCSMNKL